MFRYNSQQIQEDSSRHWRLHDTKSTNSDSRPRIGPGCFGDKLWQVSRQFSSRVGKSVADITYTTTNIKECYVKE